MNSFLTRYSSTTPEADIRKAKELYGEDDDVSEMIWGSAGGFGNLAKGVPTFKVPAVPDVRSATCRRVPLYPIGTDELPLAHLFPPDAHR